MGDCFGLTPTYILLLRIPYGVSCLLLPEELNEQWLETNSAPRSLHAVVAVVDVGYIDSLVCL